jgi:hypothetical protein
VAALGEGISVEAWRIYLDDCLARMGVTATADPVARMLAVQLVLVDHAVSRLLVRATGRAGAAEAGAYYAAAARLLAELRRTALALKAYGVGAARRAAAPRTRARPSGGRPARRVKKAQRGKVGSNNGHRVRGHSRGRKHAVG